MSAYNDYYIPEVEKFLGRTVTDDEHKDITGLYLDGWHPARVAEYISHKNLQEVVNEYFGFYSE